MDIDPSYLLGLLSDATQKEIVKYGFLFTMAAWIHSSRVKKEIKLNFTSLTEAINNIAVTLREDLEKHGKRLDSIESRVQNLEKK